MAHDHILDSPDHEFDDRSFLKAPNGAYNDTGELRCEDENEVDDSISPHHERQ